MAATPDEIEQVRRRVDEPNQTTYSDILVSQIIEDEGSLVGACYRIWTEKAAKLAGLTDVSEAGASHKLSDLHKNALAMARVYSDLLTTGSASPTPAVGPRVKKIVRSS